MDIETVGTSGATPARYATLIRQRRELDVELAALRAEAVAEFKQRILAEAKELEIDLQILFAGEASRRAREPHTAPAKYRDPHNAANTWSGRGRPPAWLQAYIDAGRDKDEFCVA